MTIKKIHAVTKKISPTTPVLGATSSEMPFVIGAKMDNALHYEDGIELCINHSKHIIFSVERQPNSDLRTFNSLATLAESIRNLVDGSEVHITDGSLYIASRDESWQFTNPYGQAYDLVGMLGLWPHHE